MSAVIFVVLAVAWAVYLIPKSLKHHDELASDRLVEGHSDKVRILKRHAGTADTTTEAVVQPSEEAAGEHGDPAETVAASPAPVAARALPTRAAARRAARNRRRVLYVLTLALAVVAGLAEFALVPWWSTAIPGGLILVFLVIARFTVRAARARRAGRPVAASAAVTTPVEVEPVVAVEPGEAATAAADEAALEMQAALADDGSLWDPLPMTLPTYVSKARARRTVRTIELTGISSSGHDEADTALAREAQESAAAAAEAEETAAEQRRVAGA